MRNVTINDVLAGLGTAIPPPTQNYRPGRCHLVLFSEEIKSPDHREVGHGKTTVGIGACRTGGTGHPATHRAGICIAGLQANKIFRLLAAPQISNSKVAAANNHMRAAAVVAVLLRFNFGQTAAGHTRACRGFCVDWAYFG
ncbi:predicted protein [Histoplasma capsulatum H143]|uniref:Uncharacterized protein n=1 Tax=Ajellomyces capsulatus (strain H143) TaxID=544712 RepID=C6H6R9_AJECH|nr:predicted protein [Histoplasma capsulatum H143]